MKKFWLVLVILAVAIPAYSATLKGVEMPNTITVEGTKLVLNGMALRKKVIFKVYVAGLYLTEKEKDGDKILKEDKMRRTLMHFLRSVGKGKINGAWMDGLKDNTPDHSPELKKKFDKLCSLMEDMKDGDKIAFSYIPGKGTKVMVKNKFKDFIKGKDFADALFACWIGPKPGPGEGFKEDLLEID